MAKYFLTVDGNPEREVTEDEFMSAEHNAGFRSKFEGCPATAGFSSSKSGCSVSGRVDFTDEA
jgi:hypothetical protein